MRFSQCGVCVYLAHQKRGDLNTPHNIQYSMCMPIEGMGLRVNARCTLTLIVFVNGLIVCSENVCRIVFKCKYEQPTAQIVC